MKRIAVVCLYVLGFMLAQLPSQVGAQTPNPPTPPIWWTNVPPCIFTNLPPDWTNKPPVWTNHPPIFTNLPPTWTNILNGLTNRLGWGTNMWWTNRLSFTNTLPPTPITNSGPMHPGVLPPTLPKDVKTLLKQFQEQRDQLIKNLDGANDTQRQQILQQLSDLREQLKKQLEEIRAQMKDQVRDMKQQFNNGFAPGNISGNNNRSGHGGKPRN